MKQSPWRRGVYFLVFIMLILGAAGCDVAPCDEVQRDYNRTVRRQASLEPLSDSGAPHLAMAIRLDFLNELSAGALNQALKQALAVNGRLNVPGGQSIPYSLSAAGASLRFDASNACPRCIRVRGNIDGQVEATLPILGRKGSPLSGTMDWTIPLDVKRENDGKVAIFLDTAQAVRMGLPQIVGRLNGLPDSWSSVIATALNTELAERLSRSIPSLRLVGYQLPSLGINGLEIAPALFAFDAQSNALVLGIRTNLPVQVSARSESEYMRALSLSQGQNIALAIQPGAVLEAVRVGMQQGKVPTQYSLTGQANRRGPAHVVVDNFTAAEHSGGGDSLGLGLDFRIFNFGADWGCFRLGGDARSRFSLRDGRAELEVEDVSFSGTGIANAANWASAQFIEQSQRVISYTLNDDIVLSPNMGMSLRGDRISTEAGMLVLRGRGMAGR